MQMEILPDRLYTTGQVVAWLQHRARWFYRNKASLRAKGFPPPLPMPGHPRWRGEHLLAWAALRDGAPTASVGNVVGLEKLASLRSKALAAKRRAG